MTRLKQGQINLAVLEGVHADSLLRLVCSYAERVGAGDTLGFQLVRFGAIVEVGRANFQPGDYTVGRQKHYWWEVFCPRTCSICTVEPGSLHAVRSRPGEPIVTRDGVAELIAECVAERIASRLQAIGTDCPDDLMSRHGQHLVDYIRSQTWWGAGFERGEKEATELIAQRD